MIQSPSDQSAKPSNLYCYSNYRKFAKFSSHDFEDHDGRLYKLKKVDDEWIIVPREYAIRKIIAKYSKAASAINGYTIHPFMGKPLAKTPDDPYGWIISFEELIQQKVHKLPIFDRCNCDLYYKGKYHDDDEIIRQYTVQKPNQFPLSCIDLKIRFDEKDIYVSHLGVDPSLQRSGVGTILLHMVMEICSLYGFKQLYLQSLESAISFYYNQGFNVQNKVFENDEKFQEYLDDVDEDPFMILDLLDDTVLDKVDAKHVKTFKTNPKQFSSSLLTQFNWMYEKSNNLNGILAMVKDVKYIKNPNKVLLDVITERLHILVKDVVIPQAFFDEFKLNKPTFENSMTVKAQVKCS